MFFAFVSRTAFQAEQCDSNHSFPRRAATSLLYGLF